MAAAQALRGQHVVVGVPPPAVGRSRAAGAAALPFVQGLRQFVTAPSQQAVLGGPQWRMPARLGGGRYEPADCLALEADLEAALECPVYFNTTVRDSLFGVAGSPERGEGYQRLASAMGHEHADFLAGLQSSPGRHSWHRVRAVRFLPHDGEQARQRLLAAAQAQQLDVQVSGVSAVVPVRLAVASLPAGHVQVVVRGLPQQYARSGVLSALMAAAGYAADSGASVVHERAGLLQQPEDLPGELLVFDTVVGVAVTPPADPSLSRLPSEIVTDGWTATITITPALADSPAVLMRRQSECRQHSPPAAEAQQPQLQGWVPPGGRLSAAFAAGRGGLGGGVWAAPTASAMLAGARPAGDRRGLGLPAVPGQPTEQASQGQPGQTAAGPAGLEHPAPAQQEQEEQAEQRDAAMLPAPPLPAAAVEPARESGFGVAIEYITDSSDLLRSDAVTLVQAVRSLSPDVYAAVRDASAPGDLVRAFREALYTQARGLFGEERAMQLQVPPAAQWDGVEAEEPALPEHGGQGQALLPAGAPAGGGHQAQRSGTSLVVRASSTVLAPTAARSAVVAPSPSSSDEERPPTLRRTSRVPRAGGGISYWQSPPPPPPARGLQTKTKAKPTAKAIAATPPAATPGLRSGADRQRRPSA